VNETFLDTHMDCWAPNYDRSHCVVQCLENQRMTKFVAKNIQLWHILALPSADNSALVYVVVHAQGPRQPNFSFTAPLSSCIYFWCQSVQNKNPGLVYTRVHTCIPVLLSFIQIEVDMNSLFLISN